MKAIEPIPLTEIQAAHKCIAGLAMRTPLVRLNVDDAPAEIFLKLECLQPIGSFKLRGAGNAMRQMSAAELKQGVYTASAGNMAQGVGYIARQLGVKCTVVVPDHAPATKLAAIERFGAAIIKVPFDQWWQVLMTHHFESASGPALGRFIHPVSDPAVIAGNGTIGLEILEDLPDVDTLIVPYGGGGLSCGIACAIRSLKPSVKVFAAEVETAAPFGAALAANQPREISYTASFVDGIGGKTVLGEMWPLARDLLSGSLVVSLAQVAAAIRLMIERNHVVAEGAGAASVAAALAGKAGGGKVVCVVSGGNIDPKKLAAIMDGSVP
jgi:threonine dehydratase